MSRESRSRNRKDRNPTRIGTVENYRHLWMLAIWAVYLALYLATEQITAEEYWVSYLPLDDKIPFCEYFIVPYCLWHPLLVLMTAYLAFYDAEQFKRFMVFIGVGFISTCVFGLIFPNEQNLRPETFPRDNLFTRWVGLIYAADDNANVLPSMHVIGCAAMTAACFHTASLKKRQLHWAMLVLSILICASTVLVKQHSILDFFAALPVSAVLYVLSYHVYMRPAKGRQVRT